MSPLSPSPDYTTLDLMLKLRRQGVTLHAEGNELICRGGANALTPEVLSCLKHHKQAILKQLAEEQTAVEQELPNLLPAPADRYTPFPLTENQQAYWMGRDAAVAFGSVGIHIYFELEIQNFEAVRFQTAWNTLLKRHDMLHAVVCPDGTQQVLKDFSPFELGVRDISNLSSEQAEQKLLEARGTLSHTCYNVESWPQSTFRAFLLGGGTTVLMGSLDCWCLDGHSVQVLMRELAALYAGQELPPSPRCSFRDYVTALVEFHHSPTYARSLAYWKEKIRTLPPAPSLPLRTERGYRAPGEHVSLRTPKTPSFRRHEAILNTETFTCLLKRLRKHNLTLSNLLLSCYAEILGHWSYESRFTINVPRVNRLPVHPDIESCIGEFASFSLTSIDNSNSQLSFLERCHNIQKQVWQDLEYDHVSGVTVLRLWRQVTGVGPEVGMPFVFTSEPESNGRPEDSSWIGALGTIGTVRQTLTETPQVWIDAQYGRIDNCLHLSWDILDGIFPENLPDSMFTTFVRLVQALADSDTPWSSPLPLYSCVSADCVYSSVYGPKIEIPTVDIPQLLAKRVSEFSNKLAVADSRGEMTWAELRDAIFNLATTLAKTKLSRGGRVGLILHKNRWQTIAPFAVRMAGGVAVPLDPDAPAERLRHLLSDCDASLVLTDETSDISCFGLPGFNLDNDFHGQCACSPSSPLSDETDIFSIIYTSGSTGTPKGVIIPFMGILNAVQQFSAMLPLGQATPSLAVSPFYHDMAVPDYAGNILLGMPAIFPDHTRRKDPAHWINLIQKYNVAFWNSVPSMMTMLMDYYESENTTGLNSLRLVTLGGDWLPLQTIQILLKRLPNAKIFSIGGPTEISVANIFYPITNVHQEWISIPYGTPFQNSGYHVVNDRGNLCPRGVSGELCCTGKYMSLGYLNDPEKTDNVFRTLPTTEERLYHTGDMGRMHADGIIEFLGRRDKQVKINGYRIELSEIENRLCEHPGVHQAVAFISSTSSGNKKLSAYVVAASGHIISEHELKNFLKEKLPAYMVPSFIGQCDDFPLTPNAKIDRKTVSAWPTNSGTKNYIPSTDIEKTILNAWKVTLGDFPATADANFFESGGDSIAAIRFLNKLRELHIPGLGVMDIFRHPTPAALNAHLNESKEETISLPPVLPSERRKQSSHPEGKYFPATHAQTRLWIEEQTHLEDNRYALPFHIVITGNIDSERLEYALNRVIAEHEALRTTLHGKLDTLEENEHIPVWQCVHPQISISIIKKDLRELSEKDQQDCSRKIRHELAEKPFDLTTAPLFRAELVLRSAPDMGADLYLVFHHAIFDGWSMRLFMNSFRNALNDYSPISSLIINDKQTIDYPDIADWEQSEPVLHVIEKRLKIMKGRVLSAHAPELPDFSSFETPFDSTTQQTLYIEQCLSEELAEKIRHLASSKGVTPFIVSLSAFSYLISCYSGEKNLLLGTYAAQRGMTSLENIIGVMVNPLPLVIRVSEAKTFYDLLILCRDALIEAGENVIVPFDRLVQETVSTRHSDTHPLFNITFSQDNTEAADFTSAGMNFHLIPGGNHSSAMNLDVTMREGSSPALEAIANGSKWTSAALNALLARMVHLLRQAVATPEMSLDDFTLITQEDELRLETWSSATPLEQNWASLWGRFEDVTRRQGDKDCLLGDTSFSFNEIHKLALTIAFHLDSFGTQNTSIAVCMERNPFMVASILAIWRSGCSVIPISLSQPMERVRSMLKFADVTTVITDSRISSNFDFTEFKHILDVSKIDLQNELELFSNPCTLTKDIPVLTLFTSGSTGVPKGVVIGNATLINRLQWLGEVIPYTQDERACAKADISFVDAITELFCPILHGIPVYILPDEDIRRMDILLKALKQYSITRLVAVPGALRSLAELALHMEEKLPSLRHIISSGEPLYGPLVTELQNAFPTSVIYNFYGSTEVAGEAAWYPLTCQDSKRFLIPLGRPIAGTSLQVQDSHGKILPWGIPGEITVQGAALALGYLGTTPGRVELTGGFTVQKQQMQRHVKLFRTGDRGVWTSEGLLIGLDRLDRQIKIRGQRIAPQEVEEVLRSVPSIRNVAVFAIGNGADMELVACVTGEKNIPSPAILRAHLTTRLPSAFIPTIWMQRDALPLTSSGKIDLKSLKQDALAEKQQNSSTALSDIFSASTTERDRNIQSIIAKLWYDVLSRTPNYSSNFFMDGGHSLLAVRMAILIEKHLGIICDVRDIFEHPVFNDLVCIIQTKIYANGNAHAKVNEESEWEEV